MVSELAAGRLKDLEFAAAMIELRLVSRATLLKRVDELDGPCWMRFCTISKWAAPRPGALRSARRGVENSDFCAQTSWTCAAQPFGRSSSRWLRYRRWPSSG